MNRFAGIRIHEDGLLIDPQLPKAIPQMTINGWKDYLTDSIGQILKGLLALSSIAAAALTIGFFCMLSEAIRRALGVNGLAVLSKLTGLVIAALAAQFILSGIKSFRSTSRI